MDKATDGASLGGISRAPHTLREDIANAMEEHQDAIARLAKTEHTLPARWLDMTREQINEKHGIWIHF